MCVTPAWLFCRIGTPAAQSLSMYACVSQYSGRAVFVVLALSTMIRTGTPAWNFCSSACVMLSTSSR